MIRVVVFDGGLGNQMFQYAFFLGLKKRNPFDTFAFDIQQSEVCHQGYELDRIFDIDSTIQTNDFQRIKEIIPKVLVKFNTVRQRACLEYDQNVFNKRLLFFARYVGFWQSEKYFSDVADVVRKSFRFKESLLNDATKSLYESMKSRNCVSVHIRRGDYLKQKDLFGLCCEDYYFQAMNQIKEKVNRPEFIFFSDEIEWAKESFGEEESVFVDWNIGNESWQDMFLMTQCKHNIIANSTFSWWGAWLNPNEGKIIVAPKKWFEFTPNYDILPEEWIAV